MQHFEQLCDVVEMQAGRRLVENVKRAASRAARQFLGQFHALRFTAGERRRLLPEPDVPQPDVVKRTQLALERRDFTEELHSILDGHRNPVPVNVTGEIYIGGDGVAREYLNRPELTPERFVPNWLAPDQSPRLYRTGDLGRFRSNGEIEYLGRVDTQVKLRGVRIELGEIETLLASHAEVREAVVTMTGEGEQQKLSAYFVVKDGEEAPSAGELRRYLRTKLPDHMVPASYWRLEAIPLLPSGKVNRAALAASGASLLLDRAELLLPRNDVESKLAGIWRELLGLERVGIEQNFFELGGHSLLVLQVTARIRRMFEVELPVRSVFEAPTIAGLTMEVNKAQALGLKARTPIPQRRQRAAAITASQEALLIQLEKLSAEEAQNLLKVLLDGKQNYEFRS